MKATAHAWQRAFLLLLRNFHSWLMALPWQMVILAGAGIALNLASDLGNSFGASPHFGGPWVALATLMAFLAFFALALLATGPMPLARLRSARWVRSLSTRLPRPIRHLRIRWLSYPLALFVVWTALQTVGVVAHLPHTLSGPHYGSDELYFAQYNARLVLQGQNPYADDHLAGVLTFFHLHEVTVLRAGAFRDPLHPPTQAQTQAIIAAYLAHPGAPHPQLDPATTHSYPALSFLIALPSVALGLPSLGIVQLLGLLALILAIIVLTPPRWRGVLALLCLLDVDGIRSVAGSDFAIWTTAGVALVWIVGSGNVSRLGQAPTWAAVALGLVCAVQQTAWFFAPFYLVWVWRTRGLRAAMAAGGIAVGAFTLVNLPWIAAAPGPWLHSLWLPMTLPLFPTGGGLVGLGLGGALPLWPPIIYTLLEFGAYAGLLYGYGRWWAWAPYAGMVLPLLPVLLAWRSPSRYFILLPFLALLAVVLQWRDPAAAAPASVRRPPAASSVAHPAFPAGER